MAVNLERYRSGSLGRLYTWFAIIAALVVFSGFARSYFLKDFFGTPALPGLVHFHGLVMSSWFLLLVVQTQLVEAHRVDVHRRLGIGGAVLALVVVVVGVITAISAARRGVSHGAPPLVFLAIPLGDMLVFSVLVSLGLSFRRRSPASHKRLMLLASLGILNAAFARLPLSLIQSVGPLAFFGLTDLCVLTCVAIDTVRHRRLHPAFGWGAAFIIATHPLRLLLAGTPAWMQFATWLTG